MGFASSENLDTRAKVRSALNRQDAGSRPKGKSSAPVAFHVPTSRLSVSFRRKKNAQTTSDAPAMAARTKIVLNRARRVIYPRANKCRPKAADKELFIIPELG